MTDQLEIKHLVSAVSADDQQAQEEFFTKLLVRFSNLITLELRKYPMLANGVSLNKMSDEICQYAIEEVRRLCPLCDPDFSLMQVMNVLHNVLDTAITNALADLAKRGNHKAENLMFEIIRKKLMERIIKKRGRDSQYEIE